MPLDELEHFIVQHKHLPKVPKAKDIAEKGLNVGQMQVLQMEKIEELTLYLFQIQRQLKLLQAENKSLKASRIK